jgi:hypothetical protein
MGEIQLKPTRALRAAGSRNRVFCPIPMHIRAGLGMPLPGARASIREFIERRAFRAPTKFRAARISPDENGLDPTKMALCGWRSRE